MMTQLKYLILLLSICMVSPVSANLGESNAQLESNIDYLKQLDLEELWQVEVTLDQVFDVFDGLVKARQVSIASGVKQLTSDAPAVTTVITAQDIEAIGARTLSEVLQTVPGLHVSYDAVGTPIYVVRGIYSSNNPELLMMFNGVPLKSLETGGKGNVWGGMPVEMIERLEIMRGPGSAIYGADAFAGVINIVTKSAIQGTEAGIRAGSFDTYDAWWLYGTQWRNYQLSAGLIYQDTQGHGEQVTRDVQSEFDARFRTQVSLAPDTIKLHGSGADMYLDLRNEALQWHMIYQNRWDVGTATGLGGSLDAEGHFDIQRFMTAVTYQPKIAEQWQLKTRLNLNHTHYDIDTAQVFPAGAFAGAYPDGVLVDASFAEYYLGADLDLTYRGWQHHLLRIGTGYYQADMYEVEYAANQGIDSQGRPIPPGSPLVDLTDTEAATYPEQTRQNQYIFVQDSWDINSDLTLTTGIRYDHYSDFGNTANPRLALVWRLHPDFTTKLLYGHAFRAPAFVELYIRNSGLVGNPNLKAETITTTELAFDWQTTRSLHLALNLYQFKIEDKILLFSVLNENASSNANAGVWDGYGGEFELRWKSSPRASVLFNYAYAQVKQDTQDIGDYPDHQAYLRHDWLVVDNWYLNTQLYWIGNRQTALNARRTTGFSGYEKIHLTLRYKDIQQGKINFAVGVKNLLDKHAFEPRNNSGYPLAGRSYFVELRYRF